MARYERVIYAAGFFDGEGCISIAVCRRKLQLDHNCSASAFQNDRQPLEILQELFGGSIKARSEGGWIWSVYGRRMTDALLEMLPYLLVKRSQAELAIVFQSRKVKPGGKYADPVAARRLDAEDRLKMRALKVGG